MPKDLKAGTQVEWNTAQGKTAGKVVKTVRSTTRIEGHVAKATREDPQVVVESEKTGKKAVHKPDALKRR